MKSSLEKSSLLKKEQKESAILEGLMLRTETVRKVYQTILSIDKNTPPDEVERIFREQLNQLVQSFPETVQNLYEQYLSLESKEEGLKVDMDRFASGKTDQEKLDSPQLDIVRTQLFKSWEEKNKLEENTDMALIIGVRYVLHDLLIKFKQLRNYETIWQQRVTNRIREILYSEQLSLDDVISVSYEAFCIAVRVKGKLHGDKNPNTGERSPAGGYHKKGTPFIIISETDCGISYESALQHERIHNLLDKSPIQQSPYKNTVAYLQTLLDEYDKLQPSSEPEDQEMLDRTKRDIQSLNAAAVLDANHEELLAALENAEIQHFFDEKRYAHCLNNLGLPENIARFSAMRFALDTAGINVANFCNELEREKNNTKREKEIQQKLEKLLLWIIDMFVSAVDAMRDALDVAKTISPEALEFVHFAFVTLRPSQYRHIKKMLRYKYPDHDPPVSGHQSLPPLPH